MGVGAEGILCRLDGICGCMPIHLFTNTLHRPGYLTPLFCSLTP